MNYKSLSRDFWLLQNFRNGWEMIKYLRDPSLIVEATLWNGQKIYHPQCNGLIEALIEIWQENREHPMLEMSNNTYCKL